MEIVTDLVNLNCIEPYDPEKITNICNVCKGSGQTKIGMCFGCKGYGKYTQTILFRYRDILYGSSVALCLEGWATTKGTPTGYWVNPGRPKFVSSQTTKRWAYDTQTAAFASYIKRKKKQIKILNMQLERAQLALKLTPANPLSEEYPSSFIVTTE